MDNKKYLKDLLVSMPYYRKIVLSIFRIENHNNLLTQCGTLKSYFIRFCTEIKSILIEQNEEYLVYIKNEEESFL